MRVWRILSVIALLVALSGYYFRDDLLQYREVRVGLSHVYRLLNSLFNVMYDEEEVDQEEDLFKYLVEDSELLEESDEKVVDIEPISCYTWDSLNYLADEVHGRLVNCSIAVHEQSHRVEDDLRQSIKSVELTTDSFESKLLWFDDHVDKEVIAPTTHQFFTILQKSLTNIKQIQETVKDFIIQIDADHLRVQKETIRRLAKIQKHFQNVIEVHNNAHLECACDVLKIFDDVTADYSDSIDHCVDPVIDNIGVVMKSLKSTIEAVSMFVQHITEPGIDSKESLYDIQSRMPTQVRIYHCNCRKCNDF